MPPGRRRELSRSGSGGRRSCPRRSTAPACSSLAGVIGFEAVRRLFDPPDVEGGLVIAVGLLGAAVNVAAAWAMSRAERKSLNVEGARQHVLTDLYASLAAATAGAVVLLLGFREADPIAALVVCALMFRSGWARRSDLVGDVLQGSSAHRWKVCDRRARRGGDLIAERSLGRLSRRGGVALLPAGSEREHEDGKKDQREAAHGWKGSGLLCVVGMLPRFTLLATATAFIALGAGCGGGDATKAGERTSVAIAELRRTDPDASRLLGGGAPEFRAGSRRPTGGRWS